MGMLRDDVMHLLESISDERSDGQMEWISLAKIFRQDCQSKFSRTSIALGKMVIDFL